MKLALIHDWFVGIGGAERVLIELHKLWPHAPIHMLFFDPKSVKQWLPNATIITSPLQKFWFRQRYYPLLAPFMPSAMESFDFSHYDTVLSNAVTFAKGIVVRPSTRHISYCYSPSRMLWDRHAAYERGSVPGRLFRHFLRQWDFAAAQRPDQLLAISQTAAQRISTSYRRDAMVIPPPTKIPVISNQLSVVSHRNGKLKTENFFLFVGRLVPHKNLEVLVHAFAKLKKPLIIVGAGTLRRKLQTTSDTLQADVQFLGWVGDEELDNLYALARAVIIPNEEDWGLTAVESMMHGTPVLALRAGGVTETVVEGITGEFFDDAIPQAIADCVHRFESRRDAYHQPTLMTHASQWSSEKFATRMRAIIES